MNRSELDELIEAWWSTKHAVGESLADVPENVVDVWHAHVFGSILSSCGWTTEEWNQAVEARKEEDTEK